MNFKKNLLLVTKAIKHVGWASRRHDYLKLVKFTKTSAIPAEEVTFATIDSWGWQQGKTLGVTVTGAWSG